MKGLKRIEGKKGNPFERLGEGPTKRNKSVTYVLGRGSFHTEQGKQKSNPKERRTRSRGGNESGNKRGKVTVQTSGPNHGRDI